MKYCKAHVFFFFFFIVKFVMLIFKLDLFNKKRFQKSISLTPHGQINPSITELLFRWSHFKVI